MSLGSSYGGSKDLLFLSAPPVGLANNASFPRLRGLWEVSVANVVVRFKPLNRPVHPPTPPTAITRSPPSPSPEGANGATFLHLNTKVLEFQGLFVFLGVKYNPLSPLHIFPDLMDLNLLLYKSILNFKYFCVIINCNKEVLS